MYSRERKKYHINNSIHFLLSLISFSIDNCTNYEMALRKLGGGGGGVNPSFIKVRRDVNFAESADIS